MPRITDKAASKIREIFDKLDYDQAIYVRLGSISDSKGMTQFIDFISENDIDTNKDIVYHHSLVPLVVDRGLESSFALTTIDYLDYPEGFLFKMEFIK